MELPPLINWEETRESLHLAALVLSPFKKLGVEEDLKFYHHLALRVIPEGLTTGKTAHGELILNFRQQSAIYKPNDDEATIIALAGHHQISLMDKLVEVIHNAGHEITPDRKNINDKILFYFHSKSAASYADVLYAMQSAFSEFRDTLSDEKTNIVVFPHHFDLSFLWFNGAAESEQHPHVSFGFSPGDVTFGDPYIYAYAWDGEAYFDLQISPPLEHDSDFPTGVILHYDALRKTSDPAAVLRSALRDIRDAAAPLWSK